MSEHADTLRDCGVDENGVAIVPPGGTRRIPWEEERAALQAELAEARRERDEARKQLLAENVRVIYYKRLLPENTLLEAELAEARRDIDDGKRRAGELCVQFVLTEDRCAAAEAENARLKAALELMLDKYGKNEGYEFGGEGDTA